MKNEKLTTNKKNKTKKTEKRQKKLKNIHAMLRCTLGQKNNAQYSKKYEKKKNKKNSRHINKQVAPKCRKEVIKKSAGDWKTVKWIAKLIDFMTIYAISTNAIKP